MKIITLVVGELETNCYLVFDQETKEVLIIDPGDEAARIIRTIEDNNLKPLFIINTHGHPDHTGANKELKKHFSIPFLMHQEDIFLLNLLSLSQTFIEPDQFLNQGGVLKLNELNFTILHTPGHTPGGLSLYTSCRTKGHVFTGDTLFCHQVGRYDLPFSSGDKLFYSIKNKLFVLEDSTIVYPGHGPTTTIGEEKRLNPYMKLDSLP